MKTTGEPFEALKGQISAKEQGLRSRIAKEVEGHQSFYQSFFAVEPEPQGTPAEVAEELKQRAKMEDGEVPRAWEQYVEAVYRPSRWADEITFRAAEQLESITVVVGDLQEPKRVLYYLHPRAKIAVFLRHSGNLYTLLRHMSQQTPFYIKPDDLAAASQEPALRRRH